MAHSRSTKRGVIALKIAVTVLLCYLIVRNVDTAKCFDTIRQVDLAFLALSGLLYPAGLGIAAVKLRWLLGGYGLQISTPAAFDVNWIAGFFNNFLPSSIGGDVYRLIYLNRSFPDKPAQVVSAIILDRGLGLMAMLLLAGVTGVFLPGSSIPSTWAVWICYFAMAAVVLLGFFLLFYPHGLRIPHESRSAIVNKFINGTNILVSYPDKAALARTLVTSFVFLMLVVLSNYFLFLAFNSTVAPLVLLFVIPLVNLAGIIPISINALGVTEGAGIVLFGHFGFEPELILSIFLTGRVLLMLCSATGGIRFVFRRNAF